MNTFWAFPETIVIKILKFLVHFVTNVGKMVIEIIRRNVTSNIRVFILPGTSRFISNHIFENEKFCISIKILLKFVPNG